MAAASPAQNGFNAGELSRRLRAAWGTSVYNRGADYCENFEPLPQGPALLRAGTEFVAALNADLGPDPRIIPFRLAGKQDSIIALGPLAMRIYRADGGEVATIGSERAVGDGKPPWVDQVGVVDYAAGEYTLGSNESMARPILTEEAGQHRVRFDFKAPGIGNLSLSLNVRLGSAPGLQEYGNWNVWSASSDFSTYSLTANAVPVDTVYLTVTCQNIVGAYTAVVKAFSVRKVGSVLPIATPWTQEQVAGLHYAWETGKDRMILVHPNVEPQILTCFDGADDYLLQTLTQVGVVNRPGEWNGTNWPGTVEIHKGRTWWSGTPAERNKVWASKSGKPFDFSQSTPIVASDAITETLATKGAINWFKGKKVLLCGTDEEESAFTSQNGVLTPTDIHADDESAFGSARIQAVNAGNKALYVSADKRKVRAIGYDAVQSNGWASKDITFLAEHITKGGIAEIQFGKDPHSTIALRVGGELRLCTFDEGADVVAWWRGTTKGTIKSIAASNGPDGTAVWLAVSRVAGALLERLWIHERDDREYLDSCVRHERVPDSIVTTGNVRPPTNVGGTFLLNSMIHLFAEADIGTLGMWFLTGGRVKIIDFLSTAQAEVEVIEELSAQTADLISTGMGPWDYGIMVRHPHLFGEAVAVVADVAYHGTQEVVEWITLPPAFDGPPFAIRPAVKYSVGIPFKGKIVTLPKNTKGGKIRSSKVGVMVEDSALPLINGVRPPERDPALAWNEATGRCSGKFEVAGKLGWDSEGKVTIEQDLPFRTEILAVFENSQVNDL